MRERWRQWAVVTALAAAAVTASLGLCAAPAIAAEDLAAPMYRPGIVNVIKLELSQAGMEALKASPEGEYQTGTFSMAETDGTPTGIGEYSTPIEAQIRLKGSGSFRPLGKKASFKVKFGKKAPFRGLRKMTLNNMVQDTSMVHEALSYRVFHALGVPASRTSYAEVWLNGVNYGIHTNLETLDKVSLEKRFGTFQDPPQHLYEGEYNADVIPNAEAFLQVDEGDESDISDLKALAAAANKTGVDWSDTVAPYANLVEMTRMWVAEKYIGHIDGYAGEDGVNRPNNFYLYSDPAGKFRMLPWGTDQTWVFEAQFGGSGGLLFDRCIADASCLATYKAAGKRALATVPALDLNTMAVCLTKRLRDWQKREPPEMEPDTAAEIAGAMSSTLGYLAGRPKKLATYLGVPTPAPPAAGSCPAYGTEAPESLEEFPADVEEPPAEEPEEEEPEEEEPEEEPPVEEPEEEEPESGGGDPAPEQPSPENPSPLSSAPALVPPSLLQERAQPVLLLTRLDMDRRGLVVSVKAPRSGGLHLAVGGSERSGPLCETRRRVKSGTTAVGCHLDFSELKALANRARWLTVGATLRAGSMPRLTAQRTMKSPRAEHAASLPRKRK